MRLVSILVAAAAVTFVTALPAAAGPDRTELSDVVSLDSVHLLDAGHYYDGKRLLRRYDDEERLSGANMFNAEKITEALKDAKYAKRLFARWKRFGYDSEVMSLKKFPSSVNTNKDFQKLYNRYIVWLNTHHPLQAVPRDAKKMFDRAKLDKAMGDATYANALFGRWKRHGFESDDVFKNFQAMGVKTDDKLYKLYVDYVGWLTIHHPLAKTKKTSASAFLFDEGRIKRAMADPVFAERLFAKWKRSGFDSDGVFKKFQGMGVKTNDDLYKLYKDYFNWLETHFPTKATA